MTKKHRTLNIDGKKNQVKDKAAYSELHCTKETDKIKLTDEA